MCTKSWLSFQTKNSLWIFKPQDLPISLVKHSHKLRLINLTRKPHSNQRQIQLFLEIEKIASFSYQSFSLVPMSLSVCYFLLPFLQYKCLNQEDQYLSISQYTVIDTGNNKENWMLSKYLQGGKQVENQVLGRSICTTTLSNKYKYHQRK